MFESDKKLSVLQMSCFEDENQVKCHTIAKYGKRHVGDRLCTSDAILDLMTVGAAARPFTCFSLLLSNLT